MAGNNCPVCSLISRGLSKFVDQFWNGARPAQFNIACLEDNSFGINEVRDEEGRVISLDIWEPKRVDERSIEFYVKTNSDGKCCRKADESDVSDLNSFVSQSLTRRWYDQCLLHHEGCKTNSQFMPTRLLDVGTDGTAIRLVERVPSENYVALSHCWGTAQLLMTKLTSIDEHKNGIEVSKLPKSFRDAVAVVRQLNFKYLWIDSLCIIQDSQEDWELEAAQMAEIFKTASLTICASKSSDSAGGLFEISRSPETDVDLIENCVGQTVKVFTRLVDKKVNGYYKKGNLDDPLSSRAWAYQEKFLTRRSLSFTSRGLLWECLNRSYIDLFNKRLTYVKPVLKPTNRRPSILSFMMAGPTTDWLFVVERYSRMAITFEKDRLPALAGIASTNQAEGDKYLAGLWKSSLPVGLLWRASLPSDEASAVSRFNRPHNKLRRAPTWSWTSIDAPMTSHTLPFCYDNSHEDNALLIDAHCDVPGQNPWGFVTKGTIEIQGHLTEVVLRPAHNPNNPMDIKIYVKDIHGKEHIMSLESGNQSAEVFLDFFLTEEEELSVYALLIVHDTGPGDKIGNEWVDENGDFAISHYWDYLLLERSSTEPEAFQRVGTCSMLHKSKTEGYVGMPKWESTLAHVTII